MWYFIALDKFFSGKQLIEIKLVTLQKMKNLMDS